MIYAQLHTYTDKSGIQQTTIAAREDQPDSSWAPFNVPDASWLYISSGAIAEYTQAQMTAAADALAHVALVVAAQAELDVVTGPRGTIIRCVAAAISVPSAWTTYVQGLRAIINGTDTTSTVLPTRPAYPAGT